MHEVILRHFKRCRADRCEDVNMDPRESDTKHKTCLRGDGLKQVSGPLTKKRHFQIFEFNGFSHHRNIRTCLKSNIYLLSL